ncbi:MAG: YggT family protein [Chloroflexota bacterium]|nr:YggT family protein [Chloroflexota bacterium]
MTEFVFTFINILINVLIYAIIGRALISWFDPGFTNPVSRFLREVTDPILLPIRRLMPGGMMIDFSPMIAIFLLYFLQAMLVPR